MRAGTLEVTVGKIICCSTLLQSCSVPKCNNDLYLSVVVFQINVINVIIIIKDF